MFGENEFLDASFINRNQPLSYFPSKFTEAKKSINTNYIIKEVKKHNRQPSHTSLLLVNFTYNLKMSQEVVPFSLFITSLIYMDISHSLISISTCESLKNANIKVLKVL